MLLIEEVYFSDEIQKHAKNLDTIKQIMEVLMETEFKNKLGLLRNFIITNVVNKTIKEHGYTEVKNTAQAFTHLVENGYDIIVNYSNLKFNNKNDIKDVESYLYHEFQHVSDHLDFDDLADKYMLEYKPKHDIGKVLFLEFRAAYFSQLYTKRKQRGEHYLNINEPRWLEPLDSIFMKIDNLQKKDAELAKEQIEELNKDTFEFNKELMYHLVLACGENMADNQMKNGKQCVTLQVTKLNDELNQVINEFIVKLNNVVESEDALLRFFIQNGLNVFEHLCSVVRLKLRVL